MKPMEAPIQYVPWFNVLVNKEREKKNKYNCIYRVISLFLGFSRPISIYLWRRCKQGARWWWFPFGTTVAPFISAIAETARLPWGMTHTVVDTPPPRPPPYLTTYVPYIFQHRFLPFYLFLRRIFALFVSYIFMWYRRCWFANFIATKKNKARMEWIFYFPLNLELDQLPPCCAKFIVSEYPTATSLDYD